MADAFKRASFPGRYDWWREFCHDLRTRFRRHARRVLRQALKGRLKR